MAVSAGKSDNLSELEVSMVQKIHNTSEGNLEEGGSANKTQAELLHDTGTLLQKLFDSFTSMEQLRSSISIISSRLESTERKATNCELALEMFPVETVCNLIEMVGEERRKREALEGLVKNLQAELVSLNKVVDVNSQFASVEEDIRLESASLVGNMKLQCSISSISSRLESTERKATNCELALETFQVETVRNLIEMVGEERRKREALEGLVKNLQAEFVSFKKVVDVNSQSMKFASLVGKEKVNPSMVDEDDKPVTNSKITKSNTPEDKLVNSNTEESNSFGSILYLLGSVSGNEAHVLIGASASVSAMTLEECRRFGLQMVEAPYNLRIRSLRCDLKPIYGLVKDVELRLGEWKGKWSFYVADIDFHPIILGTDFMKDRKIMMSKDVFYISNERGVLLRAPVIQKQMNQATHGVIELVHI